MERRLRFFGDGREGARHSQTLWKEQCPTVSSIVPASLYYYRLNTALLLPRITVWLPAAVSLHMQSRPDRQRRG